MKLFYFFVSLCFVNLYSCNHEVNESSDIEIIEGKFQLNSEYQEMIKDSNFVVEFDKYLDSMSIELYCEMMNNLLLKSEDSSNSDKYLEHYSGDPFSTLPCMVSGTFLQYKLLDEYNLFGKPFLVSAEQKSVNITSMTEEQLDIAIPSITMNQNLKFKVSKIGNRECNLMDYNIFQLIEIMEN